MNLNKIFLLAVLAFCSIVSSAQQPATRPSSGPSEELLREFASSEDLRAFAVRARARPNAGGLFYAYYVASICGRDYPAIDRMGKAAVARKIQSTGTIEAWHLAQMNNLSRRCAGFVDGEADTIVDELRAASATNDPLWQAEKNLRAAASSRRLDLLRTTVANALEIGDPMVWTVNRAWDAVAQSDPVARSRTGFYLNGVVYTEEDGIKTLDAYTALDLGFCKPGLPCALDDELRIVCAGGGDCARDRTEKAKNFYLANGGTEEGWKNVLVMIDQVRNAVATKNVNFFVR